MKLKSDNKFLENAFDWAVNKTAQFVVTGTKNGDINKGDHNKWYGPDYAVISSPFEEWAKPKDYKPAFWAGYFDRTAYYIRDFVHQAVGAHLVGLDEELYNMFYTFVSHACEETQWYAPWAFNFDNSIYYMDTPNYKSFVREITSQFELVETAYKLYLWTGDKRYINNEKCFLFIQKIMTEFIDKQDGIVFSEKNGIPEGKGDIFKGSATYNERGFYTVEAGDSIAAMYRAMLCYSEILKMKGDLKESQIQFERAESLKTYFNDDWSKVTGSDLYCYAVDENKKKHYKWLKFGSEIHGGASLIFIPMKGITVPGKRNDKLLDYIYKKEKNVLTREDNIESLTYLADTFFPYHQNDRAWYWIKHIIERKDLPHEHKTQGTNGDYPEISFTFISQTVEGMAGVRVNSNDKKIITCPHLPSQVNQLGISDILFGDFSVDLFISDDICFVKNKSAVPLVWQCEFKGKYNYLFVNDKQVKAEHIVENAVDLSYTEVIIPGGEKTVVKKVRAYMNPEKQDGDF